MDVLERAARDLGRAERPPAWSAHVELAAVGPVGVPARFEALMRTDRPRADALMRSLVLCTQAGCATSLLALLVTLKPGLRRLGRICGSLDEAVSQFVEMVYRDSAQPGRVAVAASLLRATQKCDEQRRARERRWDAWMAADLPPSGWAGGELLEVLSEVDLPASELSVVVATRVFDVPIEDVARRCGRSPAAVYRQRQRLERRIVAAVTAAA